MKYTRQQITEAIQFWTRVLENKSPFIDDLVTEFSYDVVFNNKKIGIYLWVIKSIQRVANNTIFSGKLTNTDIIEDRKSEHTSSTAPITFGYITYTDPETQKTVLLSEPGVDSDRNHYNPPMIYVNSSFLGKEMTLIELASIVVHEMIHQFIVENATGDKLDNIANDADVNGGHDEEFTEMMNDINSKHGLNVAVQGSASYEKDSLIALSKFAGNDYEVNEGDGSKNELFRIVRSKDGYYTRVDFC